MNLNIDELRVLSVQELVELALSCTDKKDERAWFWYLTGCISARILDIPEVAAEQLALPLFEAAHSVPADYKHARKLLEDWWKP